ncbi:HAD-IC family P-type ATPase [Oscillatoria laete-virens NRMC-F 0139]|nr:HAD-IC family P-type ATPase [Oscillatoria laete-virens]MDL5054988.1 HAD-IC family P-type ATPase [Oscillatoria laete-virens NRMC-F 0139]
MNDSQHRHDATHHGAAHDMPPAIDGNAARADHAHHGAHTPSADPAEHAAHDSSYRASELLKPEPDQTAHHMHEMHAGHGEHDAHAAHGDHAGHGVMHEGHATMMRNRFFVVLPLTIIVVLYSPMVQAWLGFTMPEFPGSSLIAPVLGTFIFFYGGLPFLSMARQELAQRQPGMMTLISVAITAAYLYSVVIFFFPPQPIDTMSNMTAETMPPMDFFWELATLIAVMLLGHWIELRNVGQAQGALRELAKLLPDTAERLLPSGATETVNVSQLQIGDRLLIRPGASIPADGTVAEGESSVNEAMITGESRPVDKKPGDSVIGGTVNGSGSLRVTVQQVGEGTALAGIMRLVEDAQKSQSRAQTLAQRAAFYLTIIALVAGVLTLIGWLVFTGSVSEAVKNMVTVLVIACPHALGLAVPLVVAISTTLSARNGLLVRQRIALESAKDLNTIIFDKTGTLTKGEQGVVQVAVDGIAEADALRIAAGLEGDSEHMIAEAIRTYVEERNISPASVSRFESIAGRGVKAVVDSITYYIGGPRLLEQLKSARPRHTRNGKVQCGERRAVGHLPDERQSDSGAVRHR